MIVAEVEAQQGQRLNASQAIEQVAAERGMKATAVSGNYYRMLRSQKPRQALGGRRRLRQLWVR